VALNFTKNLRDLTRSLIATSVGHFVNDGSLSLFPFLYPILITSYSFSYLTTGILAGTFSAASIISAPFIGRRSDFKRNYVFLLTAGLCLVAIGIIGYSIVMTLFGSTNSSEIFLVLIPLSIVGGFGTSFYHPLGAAILNESVQSNVRGRAMGINGALGSFGSLIFPIIAVALIATFGVSFLSLLGLFAGALSVIIYFIMRQINFATRPELDKEDTPVEQSLSDMETHTKGVRRGPTPLKVLLPLIWVLTIFSLLRTVFTQGVVQFVPTYLTSVDHVRYQYLGLAVAVMSAMGMISQPVFGSIGDRLGRKTTVAITTAGAAISMIFFLSTTNIILSEIFLALFGLFQYTAFPLILGLAAEISPTGARTLTNSIVWGIGITGGATIGPLLVGILAERSFLGSLGSAFLAVSVIGLLSVATLPFIRRPRKEQGTLPNRVL
jgi:MFS transporter, FSR family, fosmidomycin resistance protein